MVPLSLGRAGQSGDLGVAAGRILNPTWNLHCRSENPCIRRIPKQNGDTMTMAIEAIRRLPWKSQKLRRSFAEMVVTTFEGAFIVSRARQSGQPFITAGEWLAAAADSHARESS